MHWFERQDLKSWKKNCSHCENVLWLPETSTEAAPVGGGEAEWCFLPYSTSPAFLCLTFVCLYPVSLQSRWGRERVTACVWFGAADGCEWQTVACVGTYLEITQSCLSVLLFCSHAPLSGRVLACKASPNLTRILSSHPHSAVSQYGCQSVMYLPSEGALIVLKNGETE